MHIHIFSTKNNRSTSAYVLTCAWWDDQAFVSMVQNGFLGDGAFILSWDFTCFHISEDNRKRRGRYMYMYMHMYM